MSELEEAIKKILGDKNFIASILNSSEPSATTSECKSPKRKAPPGDGPSPVRLKKVRLSASERSAISRGEFSARPPNETSEAGSNDGAGNSSGSDSDIGVLEHLLGGDNYFDEEEEEPEEEEEDPVEEDTFSIIGGPAGTSWSVSQKVMKWYEQVADIELKKEDCDKLKEALKPSEEVLPHFEPPKLPSALWQTISSNSPADFHRAKTIYKAQDYLYVALRPLLSALEVAKDQTLRSHLCTSIQLLCSSNLLLNRYRRASVSYHLKPDLRKQVLALPVKHNSLFGGDFDKTADNIVKEQAVINKVIQPPKKLPVQQRLGSRGNVKQTAPSNPRQNFRGKGKRGRGFFSKNKGFRAPNESSSEGGFKASGPAGSTSTGGGA